MHRLLLAALLFLAPSSPRSPRSSALQAQGPLPIVVANDNSTPAGTLANGVLTLRLRVVMARWYPESDSGPSADIPVFAEEGKAPSIPGPLVRVPVGTRIRLSIANALVDSTITLLGHGITMEGDTARVRLAPGERREFDYVASRAGTYFYAARSTLEAETGLSETEQLAGAIVVDAPGARTDDRIFVLNIWTEMQRDSTLRSALAINGKSWPATERLEATVGDTIPWRVVNPTLRIHPMHLHGAYFRVDAVGDAVRDTLLASGQRRMVVTELMMPRSTMAVTWTPETAGNWLFHCHLAYHVIADARLDAKPNGHEMHSVDPRQHMAGLVMGILVRPRAASVATARTRAGVRRLSVVVAPGEKRDSFPLVPKTIRRTTDRRAPYPESVSPGGELLVLTRGQPTDVTVHNRLPQSTAIHWHGLELESFSDGVAGWSGDSRRVAPVIAPGDSFTAHLTLKRAGTFIYHTHLNDLEQLLSGVYGPLVVLEPGARWDPARDLVFTTAIDASRHAETVVVNGSTREAPFETTVGRTLRLRFINICPADPVLFELRRDSTLAEWRTVAKDGWELPAEQATVGKATRWLAVGETFDAQFTPREAGTYRLRIPGRPNEAPQYEREIRVKGVRRR